MKKNQLSNYQKLLFYRNRQRQGDEFILAERADYSVSHVRNIIAGRRNIPDIVANEMYKISRRRKTNSEVNSLV